MSTSRGSMLQRAARSLPDPVFHRAVAWWFRAQREQRLLFLDELVDPNRHAVDVGAWWGPWTYWLHKRAASVTAFEPNPEAAEFLGRVSPDATVHNIALSNTRGTAQLHVAPVRGMDALASLHPKDIPGDAADAVTFEVETRPLDSYELQDIGFIKIDVEGHEFEVVEGAVETLQRWKPTVLIEIEQDACIRPIDELFGTFTDLGFVGAFRRNAAWVPLADFDLARDQVAFAATPTDVRYINNFVFAPPTVTLT